MAALRYFARRLTASAAARGKLNEPLSGMLMARPGGIASMMRLPVHGNTAGLDACFVGVPMDIGTSNRSGTRFGPRQIRSESSMLRPFNICTGADPFNSLNVADVGDVNLNYYNLPVACTQIKDSYMELIKNGCIPLTLGGDHTISYPILQAMKEKHGPLALIHVDAHSDTLDQMLNSKITHGTTFRRAFEDGCLKENKIVQIGLRGPNFGPDDFDWPKQNGFRIVTGVECWNKSLSPLMNEIREMVGTHPVYLSFDIDAIDPAFAPGTGTPEVAGLTPIQGLEIIRGCKGLNLVGADVVEVSPPYDVAGITSVLAANFLLEMLCVLPGVKYL